MKVVYLVDGIQVDEKTFDRAFVERGHVERVEAAFAAIRLAKKWEKTRIDDAA